MNARLRLERLEKVWRALPRRRCFRCPDWPDYPVQWPPGYAFTRGAAPAPTWPTTYHCPDCGRTPRQVVNVVYAAPGEWRSMPTK